MNRLRRLTLPQILPYLLLVTGAIGVFCAAMLTIEKFALLKNPQAALGCDISPLVACGPVINTDQASAFGFPNPFMGLVGFAVVATIGAAILAGAQFKRWFWLGLQTGVTFGIVFVTWLQYQTIFNIGALCPYCMVVWVIMIPLFWYVTLYNISQHHMPTRGRAERIGLFLQRHHGDVLAVWYLIIIGVILTHFWYYWKTLI